MEYKNKLKKDVKIINVLSLFDGISCGMVALERANIKVDTYYASEIADNSITISKQNYPNIIHLGDVTQWRNWDIDWKSIDLLIGGSPCQGFSFCGKGLNFNDERSKLFFEYSAIKNHIKDVNPKLKFLLENVFMNKEYQNIISSFLWCDPVNIDSISITPMRRNRLYWFNWSLKKVFDNKCKTKLIDILDDDVNEQYYLSDERFSKLTYKKNDITYAKNLANKPLEIEVGDGIVLSRTWQTYMPVVKQASHCIRSANPDDSGVVIHKDNKLTARKFTLTEMEKMQTLPIGYTNVEGLSERASKICIGNGWTVDVLTHIFSYINHNI